MGYWFTIIGALFKVICDLLLSWGVSGESADFAQTMFTVIGFLLSGIGIVKALINGIDIKEKLIAVGIHLAIWLIIALGLTIVLPVIIIGVVIFVVDIFVLGGTIVGFIHDIFAGRGENGEMDWPYTIYDNAYEPYHYNSLKSFGDNAVYVGANSGYEVYVSASDFSENKTVNTIYGTFHW